MFKGVEGPLVLVVMDGVGEIPRETGNAVRLAHMPFWNEIKPLHRFTTLKAHGTAVGLPSDGDMGNSEVGHNALGAIKGRDPDLGPRPAGTEARGSQRS